ncbi:MAG: 16S rRNA (cytosine(1402)-N(4))-methyltransferase RsmH [Gemmatimonadales bacterium]
MIYFRSTVTASQYHTPVLATEILALTGRSRRVVDGTLGDGGHAELFLAQGATVLGFDRDPEALARARGRLGDAPIEYRLGSVYDPASLDLVDQFQPDLVLLDLGVSSRQLDDETLGFSFRPGASLDMRMGRRGPTAADLLAEASAADLTQWFRDYADEHRAPRLAAEIVRRRATGPFRTSDDLVNAIRGALGPRSGPPDFARIFQAVRIAVNDELSGLETALPRFRDAVTPGGALAVISYHSGEDRLVKNAFREWGASCICPPTVPMCGCRGRPLGRVVTRRPVVAGEAEVAANPRARSAKLRVFEVAARDEPTQG